MSKLNGNNKLNLVAEDFIYIDDMDVEGTKGRKVNGKNYNYTIGFNSPKVYVRNMNLDGIANDDSTMGCYNVIEQQQTAAALTKFVANNISNSGNPDAIQHNVFNIYNFADNAEVMISNCSFDLDMTTSNVCRFSNYKNAENVTITFENVEWTYDNAEYSDEDIDYAGLMIFQKAGSAETADNLKTWKVILKNCKYNGVAITRANFKFNAGDKSQVGYTYGGYTEKPVFSVQ